MNVPAATSPKRCFSSWRAITGFREWEDSRYCSLRTEYSIHQIEGCPEWFLEKYPWAFQVKDVRYFFEKPVVIDANLRSRLEAFHGRDPSKAWAWFVQATRIVSGHDFEVLVGRQ